MLIDQTNLDFVNSLSAFLKIQLSEPSTPIGNTWNEKAPPTATIVSLKFAYISRYVDEVGDLVELTEEELSRVVFRETPILDFIGGTVNCPNNNGEWTVKEVFEGIEKVEKERRGNSQEGWFGGIDVHHVFFEGLYYNGDEWGINWGS